MDVNYSQPQFFRPQKFRWVIVFTIWLLGLGFIGWLSPTALLVAVPFFALVLALIVFLSPGLILSQEGIEWYVLQPNWRFRRVPWSAVQEVRRGFFGLGRQIVLVVEQGRYERWIWGTPRKEKQFDIEIWSNGLDNGKEVLASIQRWWVLAEENARLRQ